MDMVRIKVPHNINEELQGLVDGYMSDDEESESWNGHCENFEELQIKFSESDSSTHKKLEKKLDEATKISDGGFRISDMQIHIDPEIDISVVPMGPKIDNSTNSEPSILVDNPDSNKTNHADDSSDDKVKFTLPEDALNSYTSHEDSVLVCEISLSAF